MEIIDRATVFARIRSQRPKFTAKPLKAIIAANPSLGAQRLKSNRGSKYGYPAELVDVAIAYVDSAAVKRFSGPRNVLTWLSRPHVPPAENRAMIETELKPFLETLKAFDRNELDEAMRKRVQEYATEHERDQARIPLELIRTGSTMLLPREYAETLRDGLEQNEHYDMIREVSRVPTPLLLEDLFGMISAVPDDLVESTRLDIAKVFEIVTDIVDNTFNVVAQYGKLTSVFQQSEIFRAFDDKKKLLAFVVFAIVRPLMKNNFEAIVKIMPITVGLLAVARCYWPKLHQEFAKVRNVEIPASSSQNKAFAPKPLP